MKNRLKPSEWAKGVTKSSREERWKKNYYSQGVLLPTLTCLSCLKQPSQVYTCIYFSTHLEECEIPSVTGIRRRRRRVISTLLKGVRRRSLTHFSTVDMPKKMKLKTIHYETYETYFKRLTCSLHSRLLSLKWSHSYFSFLNREICRKTSISTEFQ